MSTKADVSGECFPLTLLLGKRFITISENGNSKGGGKELSHGLRTIEDSPLTTSFSRKQQKQW